MGLRPFTAARFRGGQYAPSGRPPGRRLAAVMTLKQPVGPDVVGATSLARSVIVIDDSEDEVMPVVVSVCASNDGTIRKQSNGIRDRNLRRNK